MSIGSIGLPLLSLRVMRTDKVGNDKYRSGGHSYNYSQTMQELTAYTVGGAKGVLRERSILSSLLALRVPIMV